MVLLHSSLSAIGWVDGGAGSVIDALRRVIGSQGTVVTPAFSPWIRDPRPDAAAGTTDPVVWSARDAVPLFDAATTPTDTGQIPTAVLAEPGCRRSPHPQASVAAIGPHAEEICTEQPLSFALGRDSPFSRLVELDATIVLLGVGHDRSSMLHHAESLLDATVRRHKTRRFPMTIGAERVWVEARDVGDDNGTHFPGVGADFAAMSTTWRRLRVGAAHTEAFSSREYVAFARDDLRRRLTER